MLLILSEEHKQHLRLLSDLQVEGMWGHIFVSIDRIVCCWQLTWFHEHIYDHIIVQVCTRHLNFLTSHPSQGIRGGFTFNVWEISVFLLCLPLFWYFQHNKPEHISVSPSYFLCVRIQNAKKRLLTLQTLQLSIICIIILQGQWSVIWIGRGGGGK